MRVSDNVYVLNMRGNPLMPTTPQKARRLIKLNKAKVINYKPFTIKLNYVTGESKENVVLGIDAGYKNIGFSAVINNKELISGTLELENEMSSRLKLRRRYRRLRRYKLWYRKPRFLNRKRDDEWMPPSIERKYNTHLRLIERIKKVIPVDKVKIRCKNSVDLKKLDNTTISGTYYKQGSVSKNIREHVMYRERYRCQICGREIKRTKYVFYNTFNENEKDLTDANIISLVHQRCLDLYRLDKDHIEIKKNRKYKNSYFISKIKSKFEKECKFEIIHKDNEKSKELWRKFNKSYMNDAFIIAGGDNQIRNKEYFILQKRINNRTLQMKIKGSKTVLRNYKYKVNPLDEIIANGKKQIVKKINFIGNSAYLDEKKVEGKKNRINYRTKIDNITKIYKNNGWWFISQAKIQKYLENKNEGGEKL